MHKKFLVPKIFSFRPPPRTKNHGLVPTRNLLIVIFPVAQPTHALLLKLLVQINFTWAPIDLEKTVKVKLYFTVKLSEVNLDHLVFYLIRYHKLAQIIARLSNQVIFSIVRSGNLIYCVRSSSKSYWFYNCNQTLLIDKVRLHLTLSPSPLPYF